MDDTDTATDGEAAGDAEIDPAELPTLVAGPRLLATLAGTTGPAGQSDYPSAAHRGQHPTARSARGRQIVTR